ncbi:glycosyltransferase family 87 protein [Corynebacterium lowii]|uniref:Polyprenol-phosphate-mannose-dependent alpha-(1-2)-phosphatidylinositol mannoside mannosyltransferase n=1 Tax=Corynebacterium lowii TaxID=1544413 RepID=A0A0Q0YCR4_9CORY|nr:glycosyltransferase family 87 protein [Corynebacterium lowii]KQB84021.1 hypothetical protein Clow_02222 [Corynebacterium lowii]MDP9852729.1 alpha-1,2-mannosyltransferase [Corynebacterium lowii]
MRSPAVWNPATLLVAILFGVLNAILWITKSDSSDLSTLWTAGELVRSGDTARLYDFSAYDGRPFLYLPFLGALMAPITAVMSFGVAEFLLAAAQGFALVALVASAYTLWFRHAMPLMWLIPLSTLLWFSAAFQVAGAHGQINPLALAAGIWALTAARDYPVRAGVILGVSSSFTLTPLVLVLPLLLWPSTRLSAAWASVSAGAMVVLSSLLTGLASVREWVSALRQVIGGALVDRENHALSSIVMGHREPLPSGTTAHILTEVPLWVNLLPALMALLLAAATCWAAWVHSRYALEILLVGWLCAAYLASPLLWSHSLLVLLLPVMGILAMARTQLHQDVLWTAVVFTAPLLFWPLASTTNFDGHGWASPWGELLAAVLIPVIFLAGAVFSGASSSVPPSSRLGGMGREAQSAPRPSAEAFDLHEWYRSNYRRSRDLLQHLPRPQRPEPYVGRHSAARRSRDTASRTQDSYARDSSTPEEQPSTEQE